MDVLGSFLGSWATELSASAIIFRICLSLIFSAIIGCERSSKRHSAGLRTFMIVSLGTTSAMIIDLFINKFSSGKLFIVSGASVIAIALITTNSILFSSKGQIKGLTTSVGLWVVGLMGLAIGGGFYVIGIIAFIAMLVSLSCFTNLERFLKNRSNFFEIHLELTDATCLKSFITIIRELGLTVDDIELNPAYANSGLSVYTISLTVTSPELKKFKTHKEIIQALASIEYVYFVEEMSN